MKGIYLLLVMNNSAGARVSRVLVQKNSYQKIYVWFQEPPPLIPSPAVDTGCLGICGKLKILLLNANFLSVMLSTAGGGSVDLSAGRGWFLEELVIKNRKLTAGLDPNNFSFIITNFD
jgi:hypothetical protein